MNGPEVLRIVDAIHRDKSINKDLVFEGIEQAILSAARKHFGEEDAIDVHVDHQSGQPTVKCNGRDIEADELGHILGRISAQTAKQVMIQKIREAERDALFDEFSELKGQIVTGTVTRMEGGTAIVNLGKIEAILPRSEMVPNDSYKVNERVRSIVLEVGKSGSRVRVVLSRAHPDIVRRLFELEIPEIAERVIDIRSLARKAGVRCKVAVSCIDNNIDAVGACIGMRGARIKTISDELAGERIEVVKWNDMLQVLVPNALQPAKVEDVILCPMLGRVIALVQDDQLSLAIGKMGQNVKLASKLVGWDIDVMTREELDEQLDRAVSSFSAIPHVTEELAENLVSQGFLSYDDLSVIEPDQLAEMGGLTSEQCDEIIARAEQEAERLEVEQAQQRAERRREQDQQRLAGPAEAVPAESNGAAGHGGASAAATAEVGAAAEGSVEVAAETAATETDVSGAEPSADGNAAGDPPASAEPTSEGEAAAT